MLTDACDASLHFISPFSKKSAFFAGENLVLFDYISRTISPAMQGAGGIPTFQFSVFHFPFVMPCFVIVMPYFCHRKNSYLCRPKMPASKTNKMQNFAAIDFETANGQRSSVCSVGVVVVRGGLITDTFYSLIRPTPNYYAWFCQEVHGLGHEDTDTAPLFPEVWRQIAPRIAGLPLVAHNSPFDEGCLKAVFQTY